MFRENAKGLFVSVFLLIFVQIVFYGLREKERTLQIYLSQQSLNIETIRRLQNDVQQFEDQILAGESSLPYEDNQLLVVVVFSSESKVNPVENLGFFVKHGLHDAADFLFVDNGGKVEFEFPQKDNIFVWKRENTCYDMGTHNLAIEWMSNRHNRNYQRYILMNMSIRGPFIPAYSEDCWSDFYAGPDTFDHVVITGITYHGDYYGITPHVQGMLMGIDHRGLAILRRKNLLPCSNNFNDAVYRSEVLITKAIRNETGGLVKVTMAASYNPVYFDTAKNADLNQPGHYAGGTMQGFDIMFIKTGRNLKPAVIDSYSKMINESGYSSYDFCKRKRVYPKKIDFDSYQEEFELNKAAAG